MSRKHTTGYETFLDRIRNEDYLILDTETTGLDPIDVQIAGLCLYSKHQKPCYIPINHRSYITRIKTSNQLSEEQVAKHLRKCSEVKWVMHNAKFDISIICGEQIRKGRHNVELLNKNEKVFCMMQKTVKILQLPKSRGGGYKWPSLSELCTFCGVVNRLEHNALSDVEAIMKCFFFLNKHKYLSLVSV